MYLEQLSLLLDFIKTQNKTHLIPNSFLFTSDDLYYIQDDKETISHIVSLACRENRRIHSENISMAIEEVSSRWEVIV